MREPKLIIFDGDGTLWEFKTWELLPGVKTWFDQNRDKYHIGIASNQGGVGLRYWMERDGFGNPEPYPTEGHVLGQIRNNILPKLGLSPDDISLQICFAYQSSKGKWSPTPPLEARIIPEYWHYTRRKPSSLMLTDAMADFDVLPSETLMVGDREEDQLAAKYGEIPFTWAWEFFERDKPEEQS